MHGRRISDYLTGPRLYPDGETGGGPPEPTGPTGPTAPTGATGPTITPELQAVIDRQAAAARKQGIEDGKRTAAEAIAQAKADADAKAEQDRLLAAGEFDKVKTDLETKVKAYESERDTHKANYERALAIITPGVESTWKELPAEIVAMYDGAEDDVLSKAAFIDKTKPLVATLKAQGQTTKPQFPQTPRPNGGGPTNDEEAKRAQARNYRDF